MMFGWDFDELALLVGGGYLALRVLGGLALVIWRFFTDSRARVRHQTLDAPSDEHGSRSRRRCLSFADHRRITSEHSFRGILRHALWRLDAGIDVRSLPDLPASFACRTG